MNLVTGRMTYVRLLAITIGALVGFISNLSEMDTPSTVEAPIAHRRISNHLPQSWQPPAINEKPGPLDLNDGILYGNKPEPDAHPKPALSEIYPDKPKHVVNPHPYFYTIDPKDRCADKDLFLVAYIHTAPDHKERRAIVRRTWANTTIYKGEKIRTFFVMGKPSTRKAQQDLEQEANEHGDIIQENFLDVYHNLSVKAVGALRWVTSRCKQAKFILKTDDDIFVNLFGLLPHLKDLDQHKVNNTGLLMCLLWRKMHVLREGKWAIPKEVIPEDYYPPYCSGIAYIMSPDVANTIYRASFYVPFFWVDDVYITGMIPKVIGLKHVDIGRLFFGRNEIEWVLSGDDWFKYLFSHLRDMRYYKELWKILEKRGRSETIPKMTEIAPGKLATKRGPKKPPEWFVRKLEKAIHNTNNRTNEKNIVQSKKNPASNKVHMNKEQESELI